MRNAGVPLNRRANMTLLCPSGRTRIFPAETKPRFAGGDGQAAAYKNITERNAIVFSSEIASSINTNRVLVAEHESVVKYQPVADS